MFAPVLALPDFSAQFVMETDACDTGIGVGFVAAWPPSCLRQQSTWSQEQRPVSIRERILGDPSCRSTVASTCNWGNLLSGPATRV